MNRVLIKLYVPQLERKYNIWIPIDKKIYTIMNCIISGIESLNKVNISDAGQLKLYNKATAEVYDKESRVIDTDIRNGTELIIT